MDWQAFTCPAVEYTCSDVLTQKTDCSSGDQDNDGARFAQEYALTKIFISCNKLVDYPFKWKVVRLTAFAISCGEMVLSKP